MARDGDIPYCDICEQREATSAEDGVYRCEYCEAAHERLEAAELALGIAQASDHPDEAEPTQDADLSQVVSGFDEAA